MAIALDAVTSPQAVTGTILTFSHTVSGSDRILFVFGHDRSNTSTSVTGITYNGVAMTQINGVRCPTDRFMTLWYLIAPDTGTNDVVVTSSESTNLRFAAASYTGAKQTGQPDGSDTSTGTSVSTISTDITTVANGSWMIMFIKDNQGAITYTTSTGDTIRFNTDAGGQAFMDTGGAISPAGSNTMTMNGAGVNIGALAASFSPSETPAVVANVTSTLLLMGVG